MWCRRSRRGRQSFLPEEFTDMAQLDDAGAWAYQEARYEALAGDVARGCDGANALAALLKERAPSRFAQICQMYRSMALDAADQRARSSDVAQKYDSMEDFWSDAERQKTGASSLSFWDTYEHGTRRRHEAVLADAYGCEGALLVNSGMSALDVAVRSLGLRPNDKLLVHARAYFETGEYLDAVVAPSGIEVVRRDLCEPEALSRALEIEPSALLVESFLNGPELEPIPDLAPAMAAGLPLIVDNSVLGHAAHWLPPDASASALVIESGLKYLCQRCSSGVVYGGDKLGAARATARRVGVQLQAAALHHLNAFELSAAEWRIKLHGSRRRLFRETLAGGPWRWIRDCDIAAGAAAPGPARRLEESGGGALLFLCIDAPAAERARIHRDTVRSWMRACHSERLAGAVQAGFGWDWCSLRSYENNYLNRADAGEFIRVSVGIGPDEQIVRIAALLNETARQSAARTCGAAIC